jgi:hypothetical protein
VKIAIDVRRIRDFGVGTYTRNLLQALAEANAPHQYFLICPAEDKPLFADLPANFQTVEYQKKDSERLDHLALPRLIRRLKVDLTHIPFHRVPLMFTIWRAFFMTMLRGGCMRRAYSDCGGVWSARGGLSRSPERRSAMCRIWFLARRAAHV